MQSRQNLRLTLGTFPFGFVFWMFFPLVEKEFLPNSIESTMNVVEVNLSGS